MATVSERIKGTFENARAHLNDFEKQVTKSVTKFEKKAKAQLDDVPGQLKGAWTHVLARLRATLAFATREELKEVATRVEELGKKVDKLIRGEKIRNGAEK